MANIQELRTALIALRSQGGATALTTVNQINWRDVMRILDDVLISVSKEGQFRSAKVREALELIELALAVLAESVGEAERRLNSSHITWFDQILMYLPGASGDRARMVIAGYQRDTRGLELLTKLLNDVTEKGLAIAEAVDEAAETHLLDTNEAYQKLDAERQNYRINAVVVGQIVFMMSEGSDSAVRLAVYSYRMYGCIPELPDKAHVTEQDRHVLSTGLERFKQDCKAKAQATITRMEAMRDAFKAEIYGGSE
jgi:hypothetical protein